MEKLNLSRWNAPAVRRSEHRHESECPNDVRADVIRRCDVTLGWCFVCRDSNKRNFITRVWNRGVCSGKNSGAWGRGTKRILSLMSSMRADYFISSSFWWPFWPLQLPSHLHDVHQKTHRTANNSNLLQLGLSAQFHQGRESRSVSERSKLSALWSLIRGFSKHVFVSWWTDVNLCAHSQKHRED